MAIPTFSLRRSASDCGNLNLEIATPCYARFAMTTEVGNPPKATGRHRVPEWTAEQAKSCLSPRSGRVLFAPQASRNTGNPKDGVPAAPRHPWRRGICASAHGRANAFAYFSRKKSRSGARRCAHQKSMIAKRFIHESHAMTKKFPSGIEGADTVKSAPCFETPDLYANRPLHSGKPADTSPDGRRHRPPVPAALPETGRRACRFGNGFCRHEPLG